MMLAGAQIDKTSVAYTSGSSGNVEPSVALPAVQGSSKEAQVEAPAQGLAMAPKLEPVDIQFNNITCTVNLGFTKGEFSLITLKKGNTKGVENTAI